MKTALIQLSAGPDKSANIAKALAMVEEALKAKAEFVLLPEIFNFRGNLRDRDELKKAVEKIPGESVKPFMALARRYKAGILLGSILEKAAGNKAYNTSILINAAGGIEAKYRKIHLFDARLGDKIIREADIFVSGKSPAVAVLKGLRIGLSICYDVRFPDLYQGYGKKSVDLLTVPACFTQKTGEAHWETLLRARAIENLCYVLAPGQVGQGFLGVGAYGNSMVVAPWGEVIARGSNNKEEIVFADIDIKEIEKARSILPGIIYKGRV